MVLRGRPSRQAGRRSAVAGVSEECADQAGNGVWLLDARQVPRIGDDIGGRCGEG